MGCGGERGDDATDAAVLDQVGDGRVVIVALQAGAPTQGVGDQSEALGALLVQCVYQVVRRAGAEAGQEDARAVLNVTEGIRERTVDLALHRAISPAPWRLDRRRSVARCRSPS